MDGEAWEDVLAKLPIGYRFKPTDEELVIHYLEKKVFRKPLPAVLVDLNDGEEISPEKLLGERVRFNYQNTGFVSYDNSDGDTKEKSSCEWFFFTTRSLSEPISTNKLIEDEDSYWIWNETKTIEINGQTVAFKKYFTYHQPNILSQVEEKIQWTMEEYTLSVEHYKEQVDDCCIKRIRCVKVENPSNDSYI